MAFISFWCSIIHQHLVFFEITKPRQTLSLSLAGACCPSGVRLYRMAGDALRVHWRSAGSTGSHGSPSYITEVVGSSRNYTCTAPPGENSCDVGDVRCGDIYRVVVAPLTPEGSKVLFCPQRLYSGMIYTLKFLLKSILPKFVHGYSHNSQNLRPTDSSWCFKIQMCSVKAQLVVSPPLQSLCTLL